MVRAFRGRWGMQFDLDDPRTLRPWLIEHVYPFWLARIRDPAGDVLEVLDAPVVSPRRNTLSQARLTYVFSHAAIRCSAKPPVTASRHERHPLVVSVLPHWAFFEVPRHGPNHA